MELPRAVSVANSPSSAAAPTDGETFDRNSAYLQENARQWQKHNDPARDLSIQVLEKFSLVTRFARETTSQLFREAQGDGFIPNDRRKQDQKTNDYPRIAESNDVQKLPEDVQVPADPLEVKKLAYFNLCFCIYIIWLVMLFTYIIPRFARSLLHFS